MPRSRVARLLGALAGVLRKRGDTWCVFGAQAVGAHGVPRTTNDVDVTVRLAAGDPRAFTDDLERAGFLLRVRDVDGFVRRTSVLPFRHTATGMDLDVVLAGSGLEDDFLRRSVDLTLEGVVVKVISAEDLVVTKLLAGRPKDVDDARLILRRKGASIDQGRIRQTLAALEAALGQSDLLPAFEAVRRG